MKHLYLLLGIILLISCGEEPRETEWTLEETMSLDKVNPIGMAANDEGIWLSDGDRNRLVLLDVKGRVIRAIDSLDRPMHIDGQGKELLIPTYGNDRINLLSNGELSNLALKDSLDAPAGVAVAGNQVAIADFYNHRILYSQNGSDFISFGSEGKAPGQFYYPTDVQILEDEIWVADAYNNRVQVFDLQGNHLRILADKEGINAATGLYVSEDEVFITDFESDRVLVMDKAGNLRQVLEEQIEKPTDVLILEDRMYIANYKSGQLNRYRKTPVEVE